jgi:catechol 2,3-dioxygenase-like lactoylglutathione lyase family enzyme
MKSTISLAASLAAALVLAAISPSFAADQPPPGIIGVKIVVKDYQKAEDFYTKLGMKVGVKYNDFEQEMLSESPLAPRLILMHDATGKLSTGGGSLMVFVPDVQVTAKALRDAGYPDIGEPKASARSMGLTVKDPDGDTVEILSPPPK